MSLQRLQKIGSDGVDVMWCDIYRAPPQIT